MEDVKAKVEAAFEDVKESVKEGASAFLDDVAMNKHNVDDISDERKAEKEAKKASRKAKFDSALAAVKDSFRQGIEELKSDAAFTKDTVEDLSEEHKAEKAAKKAAKKEEFDSNVAELKDSIDQGAEEYKADGAALLKSLKDIAADAGIDIKENETLSNMFKSVKDSFADGLDALKSDFAFTKSTIEDVSDEHKAEKEAKREKFDENIEELKGKLK